MKNIFTLLSIICVFPINAQIKLMTDALYFRIEPEMGVVYQLHPKKDNLIEFPCEIVKKQEEFICLIDYSKSETYSQKDTLNIFKPEKHLKKQSVDEMYQNLNEQTLETEDSIYIYRFQLVSKSLIALTRIDKIELSGNTQEQGETIYLSYFFLILNQKYPILHLQEHDGDTLIPFATIVQTTQGWKLMQEGEKKLEAIAKKSLVYSENYDYHINNLSYIYTIDKKDNKVILKDKYLNISVIDSKYDSILCSNKYILAYKDNYIYPHTLFGEPYNIKGIRSIHGKGSSLQIIQDNDIKWLNIDGIVTKQLPKRNIEFICGAFSQTTKMVIENGDSNVVLKVNINTEKKDTSFSYDFSDKLKGRELFFYNMSEEISFTDGDNEFLFNTSQYPYFINTTFLTKNKTTAAIAICSITARNETLDYKVLLDNIEMLEIENLKNRQYARFRQGEIYGYFPQNQHARYEFINEFQYYFARFQMPNGKKGWLDIEGNEYLDK